MFTGIVTDIGEILQVEQKGDLRARIGTDYPTDGIDIGASISCEGVCPDRSSPQARSRRAGSTSISRPRRSPRPISAMRLGAGAAHQLRTRAEGRR